MRHLVGRAVPDVTLASTQGGVVNLARLKGRSIVYCYPYTGRPGVADPPDWDAIPGAHGSTPQSLAYARACGEFRALDVNIFGLSFQSPDWQLEFSNRTALPFALLSDSSAAFANQLGLPLFQTGGIAYIARLTLEIAVGVIARCVYPVDDPARDAEHALRSLRG